MLDYSILFEAEAKDFILECRNHFSWPHQVVIDVQRQLSEGRVADLVLPMYLKAPKNTGIKPCDRLRKKITSYSLERDGGDSSQLKTH